MFHEMRRKRQALSSDEINTILLNGTSGVLALAKDGDYPYAVPLNYVYDKDKIYFHTAKKGHKLDIIALNPKASFCVIDQDQIVPEEYTCYFRSAIVFGEIHVIENEAEKRTAISKLAEKYSPQIPESERQKVIDRYWAALCMLEMTIDHKTGKQAQELVARK